MATFSTTIHISSSPVAKRKVPKLSCEKAIENVAFDALALWLGIVPYTSVPSRRSVEGCQLLPGATRRTSVQPAGPSTLAHMVALSLLQHW